MDEPDYDDLMEDYMEEFEEQQQQPAQATDYDEAFLEEVEANATSEAAAGAATATNTTGGVNDEEMHNPASPISLDLNQRLTAAASPAEGASNNASTATTTAAQVRSDLVSTRYQQGDAKPDIFSFERYKKTASWRDESKGSPRTMRARGWKAKMATDGTGTSSTTRQQQPVMPKKHLATTPEAQLLQYQARGSLYQHNHHHNPNPTIRIFRRSSGGSSDRNNNNGMSVRPTKGKSQIPMTLRDGNRVFVEVVPMTTKPTVTPSPSTSNNSNQTSSLGISMKDLMRRVQAINRKKEHDKMKTLSRELRTQRKALAATNSGGGGGGDDDRMDSDDDDNNDDEAVEVQGKATSHDNTIDDQLWVDKHAPSTFADLLSEERTNREVLRALREWDPYVFHREPPPRPKFLRPQSDDNNNNNFNKYNNNNDDENRNNNKNPKDKRPDEKRRVILLSGPPGVGKTTLAHIVARHCGYRPMEVNGSDERSAAALTERVVRAMETATLDFDAASSSSSSNKAGSKVSNPQDWRGRPNCIILDEIDGADAKQALTTLVEMIKAEMPASKDGKPQKNKQYLKRPIIFICNNLYAPALRPLLPYARRFQVGAPAAPRLVARLRAVLSFEGLSLWGGATLLHELVTATGGDIRSCLYTLQFAAAEVHQKQAIDISKALMSALNGNGMKDDRTDVAGTTLTVFKRPKKKGKSDKLWGTRQMTDPRTSVERVLDAVESLGEHSKLLDCMYLNILNVSYIDPTFDRCAAALQWLSNADYRGVQARYVPCAAAALHLLCRVEQKPDLTYTTRSITDNRYQMEANKGLAHKFAEGMGAQFRGSRSADIMIRDTIPYSLWMLSAGEGSSALIRPASSVEILKKRELESFDNHVATLHSLGLTYVAATEDFEGAQQSYNRQVEPTTQMILEPPIDRLVQYQCLNRSQGHRRQDIPSAMKELLARGATLQGIRSAKATNEQVTPQSMKAGQKQKSDSKVPSPSKVTPTAQKTLVVSPAKPLVTPDLDGNKNKRNGKTETAKVEEERPVKRQKGPANQNFLGLGAMRAKEAKSARRAKSVGLVRSKMADKKSNTGSGVPFPQVIRLKYVKGFTQAVRNPCRLEDLA